MSTDWQARDLRRLQDENRMLRIEYARSKAKIAQLELDALLERERDRTDVAWLQGKVLRQARELKRLNEARELRREWPAGVVKDGSRHPEDVTP
jgi:hypothetical protein